MKNKKKQIKIAIPTNDRITVAKRTGRCKEFLIVDINGEDVILDYVENNHTHEDEEEHEGEHSHTEIVEILEGIDLLLVINIGKNLKKDVERGKIKYQKTTETNIEKIISKYSS